MPGEQTRRQTLEIKRTRIEVARSSFVLLKKVLSNRNIIILRMFRPDSTNHSMNVIYNYTDRTSWLHNLLHNILNLHI